MTGFRKLVRAFFIEGTKQMSEFRYMFGHSNSELDRLILQAKWLDPTTARILSTAGLEPGMNVLDVGTGSGDVALLASRIVGPFGSVVGIDRSADAVRRAESRASSQEIRNVRFEVSSLEDIDHQGRFDAVIGRYVVEHQEDASIFIRQAASLVRTGGIIAFVEPGHMDGYTYSVPPNPTWDRIIGLIVQAFRRYPVRIDQGLHLAQAFSDAGLRDCQMLGECLIADPSSSFVEWLCSSLGTLRDILEKFGDATPAEIDELIAVDRTRATTLASKSQLLAPLLIGAWARIPS